jgi:hypothetical protein
MTELGLLANILAIAGPPRKYLLDYRIANDIGSAGKEVRFIAQDTNAFSQPLPV